MKQLFFLVIFLKLIPQANAQSEILYRQYAKWVEYKKDSTTISFDLQFSDETIKPNLPYLIIAMISIPQCPQKAAKPNRFKYTLGDYTEIDWKETGRVAGSETSACRQDIYIYTKTSDTAAVANEIKRLHNKNNSDLNLQLKGREDKDWRVYDEYFMSHYSYEELWMIDKYAFYKELGDKLTEPREITYVFNFVQSIPEKIEAFLEYASKNGFISENKGFCTYWLTKKGNPNPEYLLHVIHDLRLKAKEFDGRFKDIDMPILVN